MGYAILRNEIDKAQATWFGPIYAVCTMRVKKKSYPDCNQSRKSVPADMKEVFAVTEKN